MNATENKMKNKNKNSFFNSKKKCYFHPFDINWVKMDCNCENNKDEKIASKQGVCLKCSGQ